MSALDERLELRGLGRDEVRARLGGEDAVPDVAYEQLAGVDRISTPAGHFFFRGDEQVMLYVPRSAMEDVAPGELEQELGEPAARLRSRAGGDSAFLVYPDRGVAFSTDGRAVEILEIFPPTTLERYVEEIWRDPGVFYR